MTDPDMTSPQTVQLNNGLLVPRLGLGVFRAAYSPLAKGAELADPVVKSIAKRVVGQSSLP